MSELRILNICLSKGWGGLEMYPIKTGNKLIQAGHSVFGLCIEKSQVESGMIEAGLQCFSVTSKNQALLKKLPTIVHWIKQNHIQVIHCHKSGDLLVAKLLSLFCSVRIIFTEHMGVTRPKKDLFHRWVYQCVDQVLSISNETFQRNIKALPVAENKIKRLWLGTEIHDPVSGDSEIQAIRHELGFEAQDIVVGIIGRISPGKGHHVLLDAFSKLIQHHPNTKLLIVGGIKSSEGCDLAYLHTLQQIIHDKQLTHYVVFSGFRKDIHNMFAAMNIVCLPYENEAFGLTAIEAMAAQKPIVAANTGALPEILEDCALLCDPLNPDDIAQSLTQFINEPSLQQSLAIQARQRALAEFDIESHMTKLIHVYLGQ